MKKYMITIVAAMALGLAANSQEVMKVELKNGQVTTFPVEDINRFYFEGAQQQEELAPNCEISIVDEVILNDQFAIEFSYGTGVDHILYTAMKTSDALKYSKDILVVYLQQYGKSYSGNDICIYGIDEGEDVTVFYMGINAQGKRGYLYQRNFTTKISANEPVIEVTSAMYNDNYFNIHIESDKSKISKYYVSAEFGNDLKKYEDISRVALNWKRNIETEGSLAQQQCYSDSKDFILPRDGANQIKLLVWACDYQGDLSGVIYQEIFSASNASRIVVPQQTVNYIDNVKQTFFMEENGNDFNFIQELKKRNP